MKYFMYSPVEFSEVEAFSRANPDLEENYIVHVTPQGNYYVEIPKGTIPRASTDTYLMRVESDDSLRLVHSAFS